MAVSHADLLQSIFITGLKNAHGVEHQALALMDRQIEHLANYPEIVDVLQRHRVETEQQIVRLDEVLASFGESASALKDIALTISGNIAAIAHVFAPDEVVKNSFANFAFENFEAAAYTSLLTLADAGAFSWATSALQQSLSEEQRMAQWVIESIPATTLKYASLRAVGETAGH
ncbi:ferritin-like domain-containing protein [Sphingomonas sp.]|jgi:ferritin-like metal-binding protein YciE|uniref:ferritin-like domain-containing protein n=1 Tax=Sphingomonas sp. TaxID=28214 RepID=UPI002EDABA83